MNGAQQGIRLMLTGGGTGGHLFPAIATAQALQRRFPGTQVLFLGTGRRIDRGSLAHAGFASRTIHCQGLMGKGIGARLKALLLLPWALLESVWHIVRFRPQLVIGVGGYVTGPVIVAARVLGRPTLIHEQNSVPGLANRKLGRLADRVCVSLPASTAYFPEDKARLTGNPVREDILDLATMSKPAGGQVMTLLVLGGSLGAHRVNELVVEALGYLSPEQRAGLHLIHQTGPGDEAEIRRAYGQLGVSADVRGFFDDMAHIYRQADFVVSRAGATSLAELAVLGLPALLIPYPYAADNHQEQNGRYYVNGGGALMFREQELGGEVLAVELGRLLGDPGRRQQMGQAMRNLGLPGAADEIVGVCLELLKKR
ncbi:MAG: undecaprenyldiphospho-muramoylpentapeptide beta-N-acetylglucosaminyltransferase [Desulfobulbaceae bacterium]|uniref:UDP-N-acetylglucosamine--N-acetylmuramyl-(pentapeptide) pyrophosphoryl-undecaprenol N-acetylglucosamine transferase n=1 Tax=Candidatus Desulfatifera sulfidica TaxID=2841691 RepID=A0A8J6TA37_9BACT|nr:undecaprenyldiphospho-muramoylpentapeptide beta-N-acetylglucosaminyltransferase [Candidatus Desulfatifera sulfidica]